MMLRDVLDPICGEHATTCNLADREREKLLDSKGRGAL
jgi:hypothetical protein